MAAEIVYLNSDCERIANAERLGLDPDHELVSLPFPDDPEAARAIGFKMRNGSRIPSGFRPAAGDLGVYIERGMAADEAARLTGLERTPVKAFYQGYGGRAPAPAKAGV